MRNEFKNTRVYATFRVSQMPIIKFNLGGAKMLQINNVISWACNNWYVREDNLVEIFDQRGQRVLLNGIQKDIWCAIEYEIEIGSLYEKVKSKIPFEDFINILEEMMNFNIIFLLKRNDGQLDFLFL